MRLGFELEGVWMQIGHFGARSHQVSFETCCHNLVSVCHSSEQHACSAPHLERHMETDRAKAGT